MTTQTIEVEIPDGYRVVDSNNSGMKIILGIEKIQPRRIVLEETDRNIGVPGGCEIVETSIQKLDIMCFDKIWREVKETDIPLNSEEPYLKMYVNECKYILGKFQPSVTLNIYDRLHEFIKENS